MEELGAMSKDKKSITQLIEYNTRTSLTEMSDRPPSERYDLARTVLALLQAKPLASEGNADLLSTLQNLGKGPKPIPASKKED